MAQLAHDAAQIEGEENRTSILKCIQVTLEAVDEYDDWDELFEFVESNIDFVRMGVARGLYGLFDPRTQKIVEKAEERAMDRAMMADQRDT